MTLERYGLHEAPYENHGLPMGFVLNENKTWSMSCLTCHGGAVVGKPVAGAPNHDFDFSTFQEDLFLLELLSKGKPLPPRPIDLGRWINLTAGTTNAFIFSANFLSLRDKDLNLLNAPIPLGDAKNHDLDAIPWWVVKKKTHLYSDGFVKKNPRALMQFILSPSNSADEVKGYENDFIDIAAWLETLEAPKYPGSVDLSRARLGKMVFEENCASCHGTYGNKNENYPNKVVPIGIVKTDAVRLFGVTPEFRTHYKNSWLGRYGAEDVIESPKGYVAPALDGIWASAPYFHNGSVPTLYHVLNSNKRPKVWKNRGSANYDFVRVGLSVDEFEKVPTDVTDSYLKRRYFDSNLPSKSTEGHLFPDALTDTEKTQVLEYLKTL